MDYNFTITKSGQTKVFKTARLPDKVKLNITHNSTKNQPIVRQHLKIDMYNELLTWRFTRFTALSYFLLDITVVTSPGQNLYSTHRDLLLVNVSEAATMEGIGFAVASLAMTGLTSIKHAMSIDAKVQAFDSSVTMNEETQVLSAVGGNYNLMELGKHVIRLDRGRLRAEECLCRTNYTIDLERASPGNACRVKVYRNTAAFPAHVILFLNKKEDEEWNQTNMKPLNFSADKTFESTTFGNLDPGTYKIRIVPDCGIKSVPVTCLKRKPDTGISEDEFVVHNHSTGALKSTWRKNSPVQEALPSPISVTKVLLLSVAFGTLLFIFPVFVCFIVHNTWATDGKDKDRKPLIRRNRKHLSVGIVYSPDPGCDVQTQRTFVLKHWLEMHGFIAEVYGDDLDRSMFTNWIDLAEKIANTHDAILMVISQRLVAMCNKTETETHIRETESETPHGQKADDKTTVKKETQQVEVKPYQGRSIDKDICLDVIEEEEEIALIGDIHGNGNRLEEVIVDDNDTGIVEKRDEDMADKFSHRLPGVVLDSLKGVYALKLKKRNPVVLPVMLYDKADGQTVDTVQFLEGNTSIIHHNVINIEYEGNKGIKGTKAIESLYGKLQGISR